MNEYFTDHEYGARPRTMEKIDGPLWSGLVSLIQLRIADSSFGARFPEVCPDGSVFCGCDNKTFAVMLKAEVPWIEWPLSADVLPDTPVILDVLQYCAKAVGHPEPYFYHSFFRHNHFNWNRELGLANFVAEVDLLLQRNGMAFHLNPEGLARRILPGQLSDTLGWARFHTGDAETDRLLETARKLILDPKLDSRQDALEKLWDAFERIKTLGGHDKKASVEALLDRVAPPSSKMRLELTAEAKALTTIGNSFRIRHSEVMQEQIERAAIIDWLFARAFTFIYLVLKTTDRAT